MGNEGDFGFKSIGGADGCALGESQRRDRDEQTLRSHDADKGLRR